MTRRANFAITNESYTFHLEGVACAFLDGTMVIEIATGKELGPMTGFVVEQGQTIREAMLAAIPAGCSLVFRGAE